MQIAVVGTGYVGLVSGACLADIGHDVICVDTDASKVERINAGDTPLHEAGLEEVLARNLGHRLTAVTDLVAAVKPAELILICVGTPFDGERIDLTYVLQVARDVGELIAADDVYRVVAVKSTVVPGTTIGPVREALEAASGKQAGVHFGLGVNPEFLSEGVAVRDFTEPDRIVVGGIDERSRDAIARLYESFSDVPLVRTHPTTAEMIKYASNSLLATLISFSNEIAGYCEALDDVDVTDVFEGVHLMRHLTHSGAEANGSHRATATSFLWPGCGFGGSCFPKDVKALVAQAESGAVPARLLRAVLDVNADQPRRLVGHLLARMPDLRDRTVTVLGLAFKPETDDVRESPALRIVPELVAHGARVRCHDPIALSTGRQALEEAGVDLSRVEFIECLEKSLAGCDAALLVTKWAEYRELPALLSRGGDSPLLVDGRRFIAPGEYSNYAGIGRRT